MLQQGSLKFSVIFSILLLINNTSGLRCWRCSSDASNAKFCAETLDHSKITEQQQIWNYAECGPLPKEFENIENIVPKCKIMLQQVNDKQIYSRSCHWEEKNVPANSCAVQKDNISFVKTIACNTCAEDGCNDKLASDSNEKLTSNSEHQHPIEHNAAAFTVLCNTIFVIFALSLIIGF